MFNDVGWCKKSNKCSALRKNWSICSTETPLQVAVATCFFVLSLSLSWFDAPLLMTTRAFWTRTTWEQSCHMSWDEPSVSDAHAVTTISLAAPPVSSACLDKLQGSYLALAAGCVVATWALKLRHEMGTSSLGSSLGLEDPGGLKCIEMLYSSPRNFRVIV